MNNWPFLVPSLAFGLVAVAFAALYAREKRISASRYQLALMQRDELNTECAGLRQELHSFDEDNESLVENNAAFAKENQRLEDENEKLHAQVKTVVAELSARNNEITILRERSMEIMSQLSESQAEIERLKYQTAQAQAPLVEEEASNEAPMAENGTQASTQARPVRNAQKRTGSARKEP